MEEIQDIFKSRNTILSLLSKQNFNVTNQSDTGFNEVNSMYKAKQLDMLLENALTEAKWSARIGFSWDGNNFVSSGLNANVERYTQQQWFQTLGTQLQRVSNQIHAKTMRGGANFMVVSPDVATIIESIS